MTRPPARRTATLRLLPWPSPDGKPCYLSTDDEGGPLSRLADEMEALQLDTAADVLGLARAVLDDPASPYTEVRYAGLRLAECLTDTLRVAESRGLRVSGPDEKDRPHFGQPAQNQRSGLWS
ncbi:MULTISPECIES: hypothetical protein [unclassified Streptomyces]|uniref:hypothetical protein n=1 Tax=unclassified Streptomyces TaxID=2593676 RepID=UPI00093F2B71|nr:hypothetical protein [Streptomyces sp. TSRI0107]OKJ84152.1 hypothetical protein AMK31_18770 [Streptomyces sp. TSRI0107]